MPVREVPRDVHGERARSDDQEDRGTDDRGGALHDRSILNAAESCGLGERWRRVMCCARCFDQGGIIRVNLQGDDAQVTCRSRTPVRAFHRNALTRCSSRCAAFLTWTSEVNARASASVCSSCARSYSLTAGLRASATGRLEAAS